jgi:hypothetical protein
MTFGAQAVEVGPEKKLEAHEPARLGSVRLASLNEPEPSLIPWLATLTSRAEPAREPHEPPRGSAQTTAYQRPKKSKP